MQNELLSKKCWKIAALVSVLQIAVWGMQTAVQFLLIGLFDAAIDLDLERVAFWVAADIAGWGLYLLLVSLAEWTRAYAVRRLNNAVRSGLYHTLWFKSYSEYHAQGTGEYLSWMTNDIKQIETLAWVPFFESVGRAAQVVWSALALFCLHWSLVVFAFVAAAAMLLTPGFFTTRMENLGKKCSKEQASAVAHLKDLLSGIDVLRFFGQGERFRRQAEVVSDEIEKPNCNLGTAKALMEGVVGLINVAFQMASMVLIVVLALHGKVALATIAGSTNLIAGITNGFSNLSNTHLSLASAKPYFDKITVHTDTNATNALPTPMPTMSEGIRIKNLSFAYGDKLILKNADFTFEKAKSTR